jgi:hypothetical protein
MKKRVTTIMLLALLGMGAGVSTPALGVSADGEATPSSSMETTSVVVSEGSAEEPSDGTAVDEVREWVDRFFSPDKVAMYMSWVAYIGTIIGLVASIKRLKQNNNLTLKNVSDEVQGKLELIVSKQVADQFGKIAPKIIEGQEQANEIMAIFAKILALSQENTPESRVAILDLIEKLGMVSRDITETAKEAIEEGKVFAEETKKELDRKVDEIVDSYDGTSI